MAAPSTYIRVNGVWKKLTKIHMRVAGSWKACRSVWVRTGGTWRRTYNRITPGSISYSTPGAATHTVVAHNTYQIELWGGGGPGGTATSTGSTSSRHFALSDGSATSIASLGLTAGGGGRGNPWRGGSGGGGGGSATGGDLNATGEAGAMGGSYYIAGYGGASPNGGARRPVPASGDAIGANGHAPGGGGAPGLGQSYGTVGGGGGGGGYVRRTLGSGVLTVGTTLNMTIGSGGTPATSSSYIRGGYGANGRVTLSWS